MSAVATYLAVRRTAGFQLRRVEGYLRGFARFASARGDAPVGAQTAIDWATLGSSEADRDRRLSIVIRFARFMKAEDPRHAIPPDVMGSVGGANGQHPTSSATRKSSV